MGSTVLNEASRERDERDKRDLSIPYCTKNRRLMLRFSLCGQWDSIHQRRRQTLIGGGGAVENGEGRNAQERGSFHASLAWPSIVGSVSPL